MPFIEQREMVASQWTALNPVLLKGEVGWESGATPKAKKGDGATAWVDLPYAILPPPNLAAYATLASPVFTGDPQAPTPATADNDTSIATTAFVKAQAYAKLASPVFTGDPQAPTPATADNDTSIATTAFVKAQGYAALASPTFTGTPAAPTAAAATNTTQIATTAFVKAQAYAALASPTFTGTPAAPTASAATSTTQIATTAFTQAAIPAFANAFVKVNLTGTDQTIPDSVGSPFTPVAFNTPVVASNVLSWDFTNNRCTIPSGQGGLYMATASIGWRASTVGVRYVTIDVNGTPVAQSRQAAVAGVITDTISAMNIRLVATDQVRVTVYQTSGAGLGVVASTSYLTTFDLVRVSA